MAGEALNAPSEGALSIDQAAAAIGLLGDVPEREENAPAPAEEPAAEPNEPEAEPTAEGGEEPAEASPAEPEEEPAEPELPAIEPPLFWDAAHKEEFRKLPRELQQYAAEQAEAANRHVSKQAQEHAEARKQAEQAVQAFTEKGKAIDAVLAQAEAANEADGWGEWLKVPDVQWITLLQQDPATYRPIKEQVDLRKSHLQQLITAKQETDRAAATHNFAAYVAAQAEELGRLAPELATDGTKKSEISKYLMDQGFSANELNGISARQLVAAQKAMLWDRAQAAAKNVKPQPKPAPAQSKPVKPAASTPTPPKQRATQELSSRLTRTGSIDDAVALLNARG